MVSRTNVTLHAARELPFASTRTSPFRAYTADPVLESRKKGVNEPIRDATVWSIMRQNNCKTRMVSHG